MKTKAEIINSIIKSTKKEDLLENLKKGDIHYFENLIKTASEIKDNSIFIKLQTHVTGLVKVLEIKLKPNNINDFLNDLKPMIDNNLKDIKGFLGILIDNMMISCDEISFGSTSSLNRSISYELLKTMPLNRLIDKRLKYKESIKKETNENNNLVISNIDLFFNNTKNLLKEIF